MFDFKKNKGGKNEVTAPAVHILELNETVSQSGEISLRPSAFLSLSLSLSVRARACV